MPDNDSQGLGEALAHFFGGALTGAAKNGSFEPFVRSLERQAVERATTRKRHGEQLSQLKAGAKLGLIGEDQIQEAGGLDLLAGMDAGAFNQTFQGMRALQTKNLGEGEQAAHIAAQLRGMGVSEERIAQGGEADLNAMLELQSGEQHRTDELDTANKTFNEQVGLLHERLRQLHQRGTPPNEGEIQVLSGMMGAISTTQGRQGELGGGENQEATLLMLQNSISDLNSSAQLGAVKASFEQDGATEGAWADYAETLANPGITPAMREGSLGPEVTVVKGNLASYRAMEANEALIPHMPEKWQAGFRAWQNGEEQGPGFESMLSGKTDTDLLATLSELRGGTESIGRATNLIASAAKVSEAQAVLDQLALSGLPLNMDEVDLTGVVDDSGAINPAALNEVMGSAITGAFDGADLAQKLIWFGPLKEQVGSFVPGTVTALDKALSEEFATADQDGVLGRVRDLNDTGLQQQMRFKLENLVAAGELGFAGEGPSSVGIEATGSAAFIQGRGARIQDPARHRRLVAMKDYGQARIGLPSELWYAQSFDIERQRTEVTLKNIQAATEDTLPTGVGQTARGSLEQAQTDQARARQQAQMAGPTAERMFAWLSTPDLVASLAAPTSEDPTNLTTNRVGFAGEDLDKLDQASRISRMLTLYNDLKGPKTDTSLPLSQRNAAADAHLAITNRIGDLAIELLDSYTAEGLEFEDIKKAMPRAGFTEETWALEMAIMEITGNNRLAK